MKENSVECPKCQQPFEPELKPVVSTHLPPTGKEYDWVVCQETLVCPHCRYSFTTSVGRTIGGTDPVITDPDLLYYPEWGYCRFAWSPNGTWLAIGFNWDLRVYKLSGVGWPQQCRFKRSSLIGWDGDNLVTKSRQDHQDSHYTIWQFPERIRILQHRRKDFNRHVSETAETKRQLFAYGLDKNSQQCFIVHDYINKRQIEQSTGRLVSGLTGKLWFNLAQNQVLCSRSASHYKRSILDLWNFDWATGGAVRKAKYCTPFIKFEWASWTAAGDILVVAEYDKYTSNSDQNYYQLILLDGKKLKVKQQIPVPLEVCANTDELYHIQLLNNGQLLWRTDKIYFLDAQTYQPLISLPDSLTRYEVIAADPSGQFIALGKQEDIIIINMVTGKRWSLRHEVEY